MAATCHPRLGCYEPPGTKLRAVPCEKRDESNDGDISVLRPHTERMSLKTSTVNTTGSSDLMFGWLAASPWA